MEDGPLAAAGEHLRLPLLLVLPEVADPFPDALLWLHFSHKACYLDAFPGVISLLCIREVFITYLIGALVVLGALLDARNGLILF